MRAVQIDAYGGPEVLRWRDMPLPVPGPGEIRVRVATSGINFMDVHTREGKYADSANYTTCPPLTLGIEGAGVVDALGPEVEGWAIGDRVAWCVARGSYAEYAVVPAWRAVPLPAAISFDLAAAALFQGLTAHYLAHDVARIGHGTTCLVHAGAGGIGQLLIQFLKQRGAKVLATVSSDAKAAAARRAGADATCGYHTAEFVGAAQRLGGGQGVDVVFDAVGPATLDGSIAALRRFGLLVLYGSNSGPAPAIRPMQLADAGSLYFTRPRLAHYVADAAATRARAADLFAGLREGSLRVGIEREYTLDTVAKAHAALEERRSIGKSILRVALI